MANYLDKHPAVGAAACQLRNSDGSIQVSCSAFPSLANLFWRAVIVGAVLPSYFKPAYYEMRFWRHDTERSVDQPAGAFLMVRRAVLDQVGPLDERFRLYYEDVDWCYRIKSAGWSIMFWPGTSITHLGGTSTRPIYAAAVRQMHLSLIAYFEKHYGRGAACKARLLSLLAVPPHIILWTLKYVVRPADRRWLRSMIAAHWSLVRFEMSRLLGHSHESP
jgi:GT2 family glycosyltransferase